MTWGFEPEDLDTVQKPAFILTQVAWGLGSTLLRIFFDLKLLGLNKIERYAIQWSPDNMSQFLSDLQE